MEFTVLKSIASPLFPFTAPFNLPSFSRCCNRRLEGNHDEHGAVRVGPIALGRPEARGSFCSGKWTALRSVQLTAEEDGGGPAPEVP